MQRIGALLLITTAILALGCPNATRLRSANRSFDGSGGSLSLGASDFVLTVPVGALSAPTTVELRDVAPAEVVALPSDGTTRSGLFAVTPHGTTFSQPVSIAIRHWGSAEGLSVQRLDDEEDTTWEPVAGVRYEGNIARFEVSRLSVFAVHGPALGPQCFGSPQCAGCVQVAGSNTGICVEDGAYCESGWDRVCVEETGYGYAVLCCPE